MADVTKTDKRKLDLASEDVMGNHLQELQSICPNFVREGKIDVQKINDTIELIKNLSDSCPEFFSEGQLNLKWIHDFQEANGSGQERYETNWPGKKATLRSLRNRSYGTLAPMKQQSLHFDSSENLIIEGDNLVVLKLLQKSYHGKVKMIYIDPPYNTGGDFIYPDNFKDEMENYLKYSEQKNDEGFTLSSSSETNGRYHSKWLSMMYPRLFLARNLLRSDGVIFVSISHHELHNLRIVMNEIFGEVNFIENLIWRKKSGGGQQDDYIVNEHEYIVCYARRKSEFSFNEIKAPIKNGDYNKFDEEKGRYYKLMKLEKWGSGALKEDRPTMYDYPEMIDPDGEQVYPVSPDGRPGRWRVGHANMQKLLSENSVKWLERDGRWIPYEKVYKPDESEGQVLKERSIFYDLVENGVGANELTNLFDVKDVFQNPKPSDLIAHLIYLSTQDNDIILDFFAGSGSTAHGVLKVNSIEKTNRKFILVQLPEWIDMKKKENNTAIKKGFKKISDITVERVRRVIGNLKDQSGVGFKKFALKSSNFKLWKSRYAETNTQELVDQLELNEQNVTPKGNVDEILFEIILKAGFPLTASIKSQKVGEQQVFWVDDGKLAICLEETIHDETVRELLNLQPDVMVLLDVAFQGNDVLKVNGKLQADSKENIDDKRIIFRTV